MFNKIIVKLFFLLVVTLPLQATSKSTFIDSETVRTKSNIDFDWKFKLGDAENANLPKYDDSEWRQLNLPHDWSIEGKYDENHPAGIAGGFLPTGTGWYRKHIEWQSQWQDKAVFIEFDGVYMNSEVWINGHYLGKRPYGYISFSYDISDYLVQGDNIIAVKVDNSLAPSGRWYTGSGIYRHVWLTTVNKIHIPKDGVFVRSENVDKESAAVNVSTEIFNDSDKNQRFVLQTDVLDAEHRRVASTSSDIIVAAGKTETVEQLTTVQVPQLWSPNSPYLYTVQSTVLSGDNIVDLKRTKTGFRSIEFTADKGFLLNGQAVELQGISMHHDAGPVGAAVPEDELEYRLKMLKEMGVNAIRTTHNPFSPEFYRMADEMGFMVMNEAFDGWWQAKAKYDYGLYFDKWWQKDLTDFMRRDRNHPSIIMWSVGNEVPNYTPEQQKIMVDFAKSIDDTRPITQGRGYAGGHLTIAGFNGHGEFKGAIQKFHRKNPNTPVIGTEMTHTIHTRGVYRTKTSYRVRDFPAPWEKHEPMKKWNRIKSKVYKIPNLTENEVFPDVPTAYGSSFDNSVVRMPIRDEIKLARKLPYLLGTFRWTAFDYLGESFGWPARTANFGVIDLAGFEKGPYYLYQSQWSTEPMVHLDPHWTHHGKEGTVIPVVVYTNQQSAELFLNGESLGEKTMTDDMQLVWLVPYQPGELKVVAKSNGKTIVTKALNTAQKAHAVSITANRESVTANQRDIVRLTLEIVDEKGVMLPEADHRFEIEVSGPATLLGVENGDILDLEPHKARNRKAFMGKALALIQTTDMPGDIVVTVKSKDLSQDTVVISSSK
ncbi:sugar-binding domain-containing protein [Thalassotalea agarivorans]|uniref:Beta-galactosidase n=1 Tax=Thalassotalea agarivorans TaxID=349064 RepID=A0A1I0C0U7_THASX|nr:sugar-binding domain-containing protein [Thalassotalea agarivorans]SET12991.1 beta-galactosidase [Thalassotalea agarivorans]